jgi:hypothetical protein
MVENLEGDFTVATPNNGVLYEILVPYCDNEGNVWPLEYHHAWDAYVRGFSIDNGQTILRSAKGYWQDEQKTHTERMIPVRLYCAPENMRHIATYTLGYYKQKAIMYYELSNKVTIITQESTNVGPQRAPSSVAKIHAETKQVLEELKAIPPVTIVQPTGSIVATSEITKALEELK